MPWVVTTFTGLEWRRAFVEGVACSAGDASLIIIIPRLGCEASPPGGMWRSPPGALGGLAPAAPRPPAGDGVHQGPSRPGQVRCGPRDGRRHRPEASSPDRGNPESPGGPQGPLPVQEPGLPSPVLLPPRPASGPQHRHQETFQTPARRPSPRRDAGPPCPPPTPHPSVQDTGPRNCT